MSVDADACTIRIADAERTLAGLAACVRVAHHVPGRIRLKLDAAMPPGGLPPVRLQRAMQAAPGILDVQVNPLARSCVIRYDPAFIPCDAWPDLLGGRDTPAAAALRSALRAAFASTQEKGESQ